MPSSPGISTSSNATSGECSQHRLDRRVAGPHLGDHLEVRLEAEQRGDRAADERLVVGQHQPDHGRTTDREKPGDRVRVTTVAPAAAARSRRPLSPEPPD